MVIPACAEQQQLEINIPARRKAAPTDKESRALEGSSNRQREQSDFKFIPKLGLTQRGSSSRLYVSSALVAETLALKAAITAALALGVLRLACKSDCQDLIVLLNSGGHANVLDGLLEDIRLLSSNFLSISFQYVPRSENFEADTLANAGLLSSNVSSLTEF
ncbi:hypothetical protein CARUB_v10003872mg [Capsella rubella]|uniref:RNase H type-1 domain-containing protein n=1 Tax=Capsella rubella TaxID=81985 RepID=R0FCC6_9BRAS|nr:hypothetical protein CARUB_v10003872mg [Capsella rubella]